MDLWRAVSAATVAGIVIAIVVGFVVGAFVGAHYLFKPSTTVSTVTKSVYRTITVTKTVTSTVTKTLTTTTSIALTKTVTQTKSLAPVAGKTMIKTVIYLIESSGTTRVMLLKKGVVDFGATPPTGSIPPDMLQTLENAKLGSYSIVVNPHGLTFDILYIVLNTLKPPFNNPLVRKALAYAVPYKMIWETIYHGTMTRLVGVIPKGMLGWTDYNVIHYTFNLTKAKELIKKAGIDPSKYVIVIYYNKGNPQRAKIATLLSTYWGMLGFKTMVRALTWPQLLEKTEKPDFDVYIQDWLPDYIDPDDYATPLAYGGTKFDFVKVYPNVSPTKVSELLSKAVVIDTPHYIVVVGPADTGAKVSILKSKPIIVVQYKLAKKQIPPANLSAFTTIDPAFYRNYTLDALIVAGRYEFDPHIREAIYQAVEILTNRLCFMIWLGQYKLIELYWSWLKNVYYNPILGMRFDLVYKVKKGYAEPIGIDGYVNNASTLVLTTNRWPESFDPAKDYETIGWEIFHQIGDTLVTYWGSDTSHPVPDLAVAWCHSKNGTLWFFVIRGGVYAYDPWHHKLYKVTALDALFTLWRIARLGLDPSWMITSFIDVNHSMVLTEKEFDELLHKMSCIAEFKGKIEKVTSLSQLLAFFGYSGKTAGVLMLKLYKPYAAILNILADPFTMIIPAKYLFDWVPQLKGKYLEAMKAADWGKNPAAWAKYIKPGESDPTHQFLNKYLIGTGPYYIAGYKRGAYIILKINPYYWNSTLWLKLYGYKPKP